MSFIPPINHGIGSAKQPCKMQVTRMACSFSPGYPNPQFTLKFLHIAPLYFSTIWPSSRKKILFLFFAKLWLYELWAIAFKVHLIGPFSLCGLYLLGNHLFGVRGKLRADSQFDSTHHQIFQVFPKAVYLRGQEPETVGPHLVPHEGYGGKFTAWLLAEQNG